MPIPHSLQGAASRALPIERAVERILTDNGDSAVAAQCAVDAPATPPETAS